jgi:hypothetical protein
MLGSKRGFLLMHQNEVYSAVHRVLARSLPDLAKAPKGQTQIQKMVREIMKEISESNIRFVAVREV